MSDAQVSHTADVAAENILLLVAAYQNKVSSPELRKMVAVEVQRVMNKPGERTRFPDLVGGMAYLKDLEQQPAAPPWIHEAAKAVAEHFTSQGITDWEFMGLRSRQSTQRDKALIKFAEEVTALLGYQQSVPMEHKQDLGTAFQVLKKVHEA